jgi:Holliday junction DNA helicase RuvB
MEKFDQIELLTNHDLIEDFKHDFVPQSFDDYLGQTALKQKLQIYTTAAKQRNEPLDHMLLFGPPGLGKTTLSQIMAQVLGVNIKICSGPMLERTGDLVAILSGLDPRDILFIDEIHRMAKNVEEVLYSAMEHFRVDVIIGQGAGAKTVNLPIAPFTLVGATTKSGMLSAPLRSRFGITERLEFYTPEELAQIVLQTAKFLQTKIDFESALKIAKCARGTPRIAKKILRRVRDYAQVTNQDHASASLVDQALNFLGLDQDGLSHLDNVLLKRILDNFGGGPVGLETLASILGEDCETIENVYEPYLLRIGYLEKTSRGRQIPASAQAYLRKKFF